MKSQVGDRILIKNAVPVNSITSLAEGYIINCCCEAKSQATINNYQDKLKRFMWFYQVNVDCMKSKYNTSQTQYVLKRSLIYVARNSTYSSMWYELWHSPRLS